MNKYNTFQLNWMIQHNHSVLDLTESLLRYLSCNVSTSAMSEIEQIANSAESFLNCWENDTGFGGEIWPCEAEWKDCENNENTKPQSIQLEMQAFDGRLKLIAEENPAPEYGPEITIGLADANDNYLQDLALVRERKTRQNNSDKPESAMEVLIQTVPGVNRVLWKDEYSEGYTERIMIPLWPDALTEVEVPENLSPESSLARSISDKGMVDIAYMESLTGLNETDLAESLKGKIFPVPEQEGSKNRSRYVTAGEYLSGTREELQKKLKDACAASEFNVKFDENVNALNQVLNEKSYLDEVSRKYIKSIGGWIDSNDMIHVKTDAPYLQDAVKYPGKKSLMIPTNQRITLIFEGLHFILDNEESL